MRKTDLCLFLNIYVLLRKHLTVEIIFSSEFSGRKEAPMILFLNARVRSASRTKRLADHLIVRLSDDVKEIKL